MVWKRTFKLRAGERAVGRVSGWVKRADRADRVDRASGSSSKWDQSRKRLGEAFYLTPEAMSIARSSKTGKVITINAFENYGIGVSACFKL